MTQARLYMDWNATAPLLPAAREACVHALNLVGNPSSVHAEGRRVRALIEVARRDVAALCKVEPTSVVFTGGATEAANMVLTPHFRMGRTPLDIGHLYVSAIEHPAIREGGRFARDKISHLPVLPDGTIDLHALEADLFAHDPGAGLPMVAVMLVNNETGIIQPVAKVSRLVKAAGGIMVVDAVQAAGRMTLSIDELGADFLIVSSHKIGGPKGVGALIARGDVLMPEPLVRGGGQEKGHRSGTENLAAIAGFAAAARSASEGIEDRMAFITARRDALEAEMCTLAPDLVIHGRTVSRIGNTSFFTLPGLKAETGQIAFDLEGVALSAGSACASGKVGQSHVLSAMGFDSAFGGLRLSIGPLTTDADITRFVEVFSRIVRRRRQAAVAA